MKILKLDGQRFEQLEVYHVGFVVDDVPRAAAAWTRIYGAGPFWQFNRGGFEEMLYHGEPIKLEFSAAYGKFGRTHVELLNYKFEAQIPELQAILSPTPMACNHTGFLARDAREASARLSALGLPMFLEGRSDSTGHRTYWHDARHEVGHFIEIYDDQPAFRQFHAAVDEAADGWDGRLPLRTEMPQLPAPERS